MGRWPKTTPIASFVVGHAAIDNRPVKTCSESRHKRRIDLTQGHKRILGQSKRSSQILAGRQARSNGPKVLDDSQVFEPIKMLLESGSPPLCPGGTTPL